MYCVTTVYEFRVAAGYTTKSSKVGVRTSFLCSVFSIHVSCHISFSGLSFSDVWHQKKQVHVGDARPDSLGFIDQHHAGAVLPDELSPGEDEVTTPKESVILLS